MLTWIVGYTGSWISVWITACDIMYHHDDENATDRFSRRTRCARQAGVTWLSTGYLRKGEM